MSRNLVRFCSSASNSEKTSSFLLQLYAKLWKNTADHEATDKVVVINQRTPTLETLVEKKKLKKLDVENLSEMDQIAILNHLEPKFEKDIKAEVDPDFNYYEFYKSKWATKMIEKQFDKHRTVDNDGDLCGYFSTARPQSQKWAP